MPFDSLSLLETDRRPRGRHPRSLARLWSRLVMAYRVGQCKRHLGGLSDHLLKDIGLVRSELERAARRSSATFNP